MISEVKVNNFRVFLGLALLLNQLVPLGRIREFYSSAGYYTSESIQKMYPDRFSIFFFNDSLLIIYLSYVAMIGALLCFIFGFYPRIANLISFIFIVSFQNRDPMHTYGAHAVLYNIQLLSLFCGFNQKNCSPLPFLAIKIQMALIYFGAVVPKLAASDWWSGKYVFSMINYPHRSYLPLLWLHDYPVIINILTFSVLAAELSFPFLIWFQRTRLAMILIMMCFHAGIFFTYNVVLFSPIMILLLTVFLNDQEHTKIKDTFDSFFSENRQQG